MRYAPRIFALTAILFALPLAAQPVRLVKNGSIKCNIVAERQSEEIAVAADILQRYLSESFGGAVKVGDRVKKGSIVLSQDGKLPEDAFSLRTEGGAIRISGNGKGVVYGACDFLEHEIGMDYWGGGEYDLPRHRTLEVEPSRTEVPTFSHRQCNSYFMMQGDSLYRWWYRFEGQDELFVDNLWVHTCNALLPASRYGEEHPEYYAWYGGERHPGSASQWCLSNPEVLEIVIGRVDSLFRAHPERRMISISQNDGSDTYCRCPECQKIIDEEGSLSGPVIRFVNAVAERFPDREISTLAYLFTVEPPKVTKPRSNVSIMLCDIDCRRQTSLEENPSGQAFMKALRGWSEISDNIFLWDYGINFDNYLSPFPNFQTIKDNILIFRRHNVKMHFAQINPSRGGDFAEMRPYLESKLMWNADASLDSLERHFAEGYYGATAPFILRYIHTLEGAAVGTDVDLFIYDSPVSYKANILRPELRRRYDAMFDDAEAAVANDPVRLARVRRTRLPLQYSALEIARTEKDRDPEAVEALLELFEERIREADVRELNERHNSPLEYIAMYRDRYMKADTDNLASGCPVTYVLPPHKRYAALAETALTDGLYGGAGYVENWVGWEGEDAEFIIDLGEIKSVSSISVDFLRQIGAWVLEPRGVHFWTSTDGQHYRNYDFKGLPECRDGKIEFRLVTASRETDARYIRIRVDGTNTCPEWHYGVGNPCWFFIDEVVVK